MVISTKTWEKIQQAIIFSYLAVFPLGQLPRLFLNLMGVNWAIHVADIIIVLAFGVTLMFDPFHLIKDKLTRNLAVVFVFSYIVSIPLFSLKIDLSSILYLLRFLAYLSLFHTARELFRKKDWKKLLKSALVFEALVIAIFGIAQYIFLPDLRTLYTVGWDDHYFRLVSTFLDPAFTGIILVLGILTTLENKFNKQKIGIIIVIFVALLLTYSRASFVALFAGSLVLYWNKIFRHKTVAISVCTVAIVALLLLPRPGGEGVNLLRTSSINLKLQNYSESFSIIKKSPLFGLGYNNLCLYRGSIASHSCAGLDNSFLFILATTGVVGIVVYLDFLKRLFRNTQSKIFLASLGAIIVHTQFTNTIFYSWILGWIAILYGVSFKDNKLRK